MRRLTRFSRLAYSTRASNFDSRFSFRLAFTPPFFGDAFLAGAAFFTGLAFLPLFALGFSSADCSSSLLDSSASDSSGSFALALAVALEAGARFLVASDFSSSGSSF